MTSRTSTDRGVGRRLALGFVAFALLAGAGVTVAVRAEIAVARSLREVATLAEEGRRTALVGALLREFYIHQAHIALGMEVREHAGHARHARHQLREAIARLPRDELDARARVDGIDKLFEERFMPAHAAGRTAEANRVHFEAVAQVQRLSDDLGRAEEAVATRIAEARAQADNATRWSTLVSVSAVGAAVVGALLVAVRVTRAVTAPIRRLESAAALGRVAAGIAHEINNPLGAILGHARMIQRAGGPAAEDAAVIASEALVCQDIVKALLDYAKPGSLKEEQVDLAELVRLVADRHECVVEGPAALAVRGDRGRLQQLLANLVQNGVDLGQQVWLTISAGEKEATVVVEDDGPGIPEADREQVFEPFFSKRKGGTGLGLAIARAVAEAHGGTLTVEPPASHPGARFVLRLPRG